MPKNKYRVEFKGTEITRTSDRSYAFVTVSLGHSAESVRARDESYLASDRKSLAEYQAVVAAGVVPDRVAYGRVIKSLLSVEDYRGFAANTERAIAARELRLATADYSEDSREVYAHGWSSRRDLAEANARKARELGYLEVTVLEVPQP